MAMNVHKAYNGRIYNSKRLELPPIAKLKREAVDVILRGENPAFSLDMRGMLAQMTGLELTLTPEEQAALEADPFRQAGFEGAIDAFFADHGNRQGLLRDGFCRCHRFFHLLYCSDHLWASCLLALGIKVGLRLIVSVDHRFVNRIQLGVEKSRRCLLEHVNWSAKKWTLLVVSTTGMATTA